jgi:23S rRNA (cytidine1920-2'-O)/16S rRNA (cytidine1409-2'-O)-methyltransferase
MIPDSAPSVNFGAPADAPPSRVGTLVTRGCLTFRPLAGILCLVMARVQKERLDLLLVERELALDKRQALRLIMAGQVFVAGQRVDKPGTRVPVSADLSVRESLTYASRGGLKLEAALDAFGLEVSGWIVADVGASTGGFTDCLLQRWARRVYAIDVGYGQLAWKLQKDPRVIVIDRTNARHLESVGEAVDLATIDVSFISLKLILPAVVGWLKDQGRIVALIKPQFEAKAQQVEKGGVVRDPEVHRAVLNDVIDWAAAQGLGLAGLIRSPLIGPAGNVEFLAHWTPSSDAADLQPDSHSDLIERCLKAQGGDADA